jgi:hypothetical protein
VREGAPTLGTEYSYKMTVQKGSRPKALLER